MKIATGNLSGIQCTYAEFMNEDFDITVYNWQPFENYSQDDYNGLIMTEFDTIYASLLKVKSSTTVSVTAEREDDERKLALAWFKSKDIDVRLVGGTELYVTVNDEELLLSPSEISYRADLQKVLKMINSEFKIGQTVYWLTYNITECQIMVVEAVEHLMADRQTHTTKVRYRLTTGHGDFIDGSHIFATKGEAAKAFMKANGMDCGFVGGSQ